jgi:hypothetical protein
VKIDLTAPGVPSVTGGDNHYQRAASVTITGSGSIDPAGRLGHRTV